MWENPRWEPRFILTRFQRIKPQEFRFITFILHELSTNAYQNTISNVHFIIYSIIKNVIGIIYYIICIISQLFYLDITFVS